MRLIGTLQHEPEARRFSAYLTSKGIDNSADPSFDPSTNQFQYSIWIHNEDQIQPASTLFGQFVANPSNRTFDIPIQDQIPTDEEIPPESILVEQPRKIPYATHFFLALCVFVFLLNLMQSMSLRKEGVSEDSVTPVQMTLLYDVPPVLEQLETIIEQHKLAPGQKLDKIPPEVQQELKVVDATPFWRGFYDWLFLKLTGKDDNLALGPPFVKIRQGEVWRLFSPALLHADLLHILFNMLWLWMLGRQIEFRIGKFRYILLTLLLGIASNTLQYLMSGPFFLGYSGIIMGLAGFIWCREKIAPWEGYPLQRSVIVFLVLFVLAMFALQIGSLLFAFFNNSGFTPNIANTAHISGAIFGALLARLSFFAARPIQ
jgi:GlpG protein